jgi:hypothetical protein
LFFEKKWKSGYSTDIYLAEMQLPGTSPPRFC